ncbi:hypothetical protein [Candidatus Coxiella mudrowiae]|uniref:hypothetical protein n=1 Tax=Candidatus Coxiella mudrowiae TaxID=2054173 RepID=UPI002468140D|nr:hypothetical protein [Candidatus Coxiella mudrowiae]
MVVFEVAITIDKLKLILDFIPNTYLMPRSRNDIRLDKEQLALQKNNLYRDNYRRLMSCLITIVIIGLGLLAVLSYQIMTTGKTTYYATTTTG